MSKQDRASADLGPAWRGLLSRSACRRAARATGLAIALALVLPVAANAATLAVTTTTDSNDGSCTVSLCSFRDALNAAGTGDTIVMGPGTFKATMIEGNGDWAPSGEYTIQGAGAGKTIIDGNGLDRTFAFYGKITVIGVTVTGGKAPLAGCVCGGGFQVRQGGFLTLVDSVVQGNSAPDGGGGINVDSESKAVLQNVLVSQNTTAASNGGGIRVQPVGAGGTLRMTNVTISGNATTGSSGAGLDNQGASTGTNVTLAGNASSGEGGGVLNESGGTLALGSSTIAANIAAELGVGIRNLGASGAVTLRNTIVADGCSGAATPAVASQGHNLDAGTSCGFAALGDLTKRNPLLGPLGNNGGPIAVPTMALTAGSPAIEAGDNAACPATDERGIVRPHGLVCDIGAYELSSPVVTTGPASALTTSGATVGGTVNPSTFDAGARIEYGTTTAYGSSTPAQDVGSGASAVAVTAALSGLAPGTTYHYRLIASNRDGTSVGADATFVTGGGLTVTLPVTLPVTPPVTLPVMPPATLPVITGAGQSASKWREGSALPQAAARRKPPVGTTFSFTLNEAATVQFAFTETVSGRKVGSKCLAQTRANRRKHGCTRTLTVATFTFAGHAGANTLRFQGRVSPSKKLGPGAYKLVITATNAAGQRSTPQRLGFTIVRK